MKTTLLVLLALVVGAAVAAGVVLWLVGRGIRW